MKQQPPSLHHYEAVVQIAPKGRFPKVKKVMYYPEEVIQQVVEANDIVQVIGQYVSLKKSGANYMGLCPFHTEKTPSFSVSGSKQFFHCFGCGESGNVITFLMKYENYSFQEALKVLADRAGIRLPEAHYSEEAKQKARQREVLLAINKAAATYYYKLLRSPKGKNGLSYFKKRQLSAETMNKFGLGFADGARNDLLAFLRKEGYQDEDILASGVAAFDEKRGLHDKFWNRVMFPIMDVTNRVIGFGGRVMGDGQPKYLNSPETPVFDKSRNLYGLNLAKRSRADYFILCEGYMDTIAMHQAGFDMAVASLGTAFTQQQAQILKRYNRKILLDYDSDGAGVKAAMRNIGILRSVGIQPKVIDMRPAKDADEFMKTLGADEYRKRIENAENSFLYEIRQISTQYQMDDPDARTQFQHEVARRLCSFSDDLERENYTKTVAQTYFIPLESLRKEIASYQLVGVGTPGLEESGRPQRIRPRREGAYNRQEGSTAWKDRDSGRNRMVEVSGAAGSARPAAGREGREGNQAGYSADRRGDVAGKGAMDRSQGTATRRSRAGALGTGTTAVDNGGASRQNPASSPVNPASGLAGSASGAQPGSTLLNRARDRKVEQGVLQNERLLITWLSDQPTLYLQIKDVLGPSDFEEGIVRQAAELYFGMLAKHFGDPLQQQSGQTPDGVVQDNLSAASHVSPASVIGMFDDEQDQQEVTLLFDTRIQGLDSRREREQALRDVLLGIKRASLARAMQTPGPDMLKTITKLKQEMNRIQRMPLTLE